MHGGRLREQIPGALRLLPWPGVAARTAALGDAPRVGGTVKSTTAESGAVARRRRQRERSGLVSIVARRNGMIGVGEVSSLVNLEAF